MQANWPEQSNTVYIVPDTFFIDSIIISINICTAKKLSASTKNRGPSKIFSVCDLI